MERCWKILSTARRNLVAGTRYTYPADGQWTDWAARDAERDWQYRRLLQLAGAQQ